MWGISVGYSFTDIGYNALLYSVDSVAMETATQSSGMLIIPDSPR